MTTITIAPARLSHYDVVAALLERAHLPLDGLRQHFENGLVARAGHRIVGCSALEVYEDGALLRSVAVDAEYRHMGIGSDLTNAALDLAARRNMSAVYLLTETAERFFPRFGFEMIDRADVPPSVRQSAEFVRGCCPSAFVMRKFVTPTT